VANLCVRTIDYGLKGKKYKCFLINIAVLEI